MRIFLIILFISTATPLFSQDLSFDEIKNFQIEKLQGKELILNFTVPVDNPLDKSFGVTIKKGKIFKNGELFGDFKLLKKVKLKKKSKQDVNVRVKVNLKQEFSLAQEGLKALQSKNITFRLEGKFKATWFIFWKTFPFSHEEKLSLKKLLGQ